MSPTSPAPSPRRIDRALTRLRAAQAGGSPKALAAAERAYVKAEQADTAAAARVQARTEARAAREAARASD